MEALQGQEQRQKLMVSFEIGMRGFSVCAHTYAQGCDRAHVVEWSHIPLIAEKEKGVDIHALSFRLYKTLDLLIGRLMDAKFSFLDTVFIESQPTKIGCAAMKGIQMMMFSYFQMRKYREPSLIGDVLFIAPCWKLKDHTKVITIPDVIGKKNKRTHTMTNLKKELRVY